MTKDKEHIKWIDIARTFAIVCVVLNHAIDSCYNTSGNILKENSFASGIVAYSGLTIGRIGVPIFLMISGYLLLSRDWNQDNCIKFWKKNWLRLFICTEIWWVIYAVRNYISLDVFPRSICMVLQFGSVFLLTWMIVALISRIPKIGPFIFNER